MGDLSTEEMRWREFLERRDEALPEFSPADARALRLVRAWHRHPDLIESLRYGVIDIGDVVEFVLLQEVLSILADEDGFSS